MRVISMVLLATLATAIGCGDYKPAPVPQTPPPQPVAAPAPAPAPAPQMVVEKADVGVGKKGRDYGPGLVTTPVAQYFAAKEAIVFRIEVPHALQLYKATNGKGPQTTEEFLKVLKENQIRLPELKEGHHYAYDVQKEELQVVHPAE
jgi:hypothetical protein